MGHPTQHVDDPEEQQRIWHVCWQAAAGRDFCRDPVLRDRIRQRLLESHRQAGRVLVSFALLPTEIHIVTQLRPDDSAGSVARAIGAIVSRWARDAQPLRSPVLAGRHRAYRVDSISALLEDVRLLAWRPVWLGLSRSPSHCPYGAARIALGLSPARGFDSRPLLQHFGVTVPQARAAMRDWMGARPTEVQCRVWELMHGLSLATGSVGPQQAMARQVEGAAAAALVAAGGTAGIDGALQLMEAWVAVRLGIARSASDQRAGETLTGRGRAMVAMLASEHSLCSAASVARYFKRAKATLSEQMSNCRADPVARQIVALPVERIIDEAKCLVTRSKVVLKASRRLMAAPRRIS